MKTTEHDPSGGGLIGKTNDFPDNRLRRASHNHQKGPYESWKHALAGARRRQYSSTGRLSGKTSGALRVQGNHLHWQGWKLASDSQRRIHGLLVQHRSDTGRSHRHERTDVTHERGWFRTDLLGNPACGQASRSRYPPKQSEGNCGSPTHHIQHRRSGEDHVQPTVGRPCVASRIACSAHRRQHQTVQST